MFKKILIANRGEIACRVIKTAKKMGILTVAVYSDADRDARMSSWPTRRCSSARRRQPRQSICRPTASSRPARQTGAEAVHPGYGFLSENEAFARKVEEEGIVFIGPKHASIAAMGDKIASKKLRRRGEGQHDPRLERRRSRRPRRAVEIAREIGYPVMIKASAGGGGKGMRVAFNDKEAFEGFTVVPQRGAQQLRRRPRLHREVRRGAAPHRDPGARRCARQRALPERARMLDPAPPPEGDRGGAVARSSSDATRQAMGEQAVALAKAVNYQSAGTVEFVVGKDQSFYFLEMNTRLQVEHPVTECITGLDLVELMIRVAAGETLPLTQEDVKREGWAIECRINAEDPFRNFLPSHRPAGALPAAGADACSRPTPSI